jgi:hypothetical protein
MANKKYDKYLSLYPEDFKGNIWEEVCDVLDRGIAANEIRIYFTDKDIVAYLEEEEEEDDRTE